MSAKIELVLVLLKLTKKKLNIPLKIVMENIDIFSDFLSVSFNSSIKSKNFKKNLKLADITPLHNKGKKNIKGNYRPVSILPNLSKIFEKCIFTQMSQFLNNIVWKYQCSFQRALTHSSVF